MFRRKLLFFKWPEVNQNFAKWSEEEEDNFLNTQRSHSLKVSGHSLLLPTGDLININIIYLLIIQYSIKAPRQT